MVDRDLQGLLVARRVLAPALDAIDPALANRTPAGFRNNLRWQLGHLITVAETLLLGVAAGRRPAVPEAYRGWFANDTSPADFDAGTPDWPALRHELDASTERLAEVLRELDPAADLAQPLAPRPGLLLATTVAGVVGYALWHEGHHGGRMACYHRLLGGNG